MRTNIDIDDALMARAMPLLPVRTKKQAVEMALCEAVERRMAADAVLALRGKVRWDGDLNAMRRADAPAEATAATAGSGRRRDRAG